MKYISMLRGINVSGQKKIKMADLKALYENLGFANVITYIQSGNVIFESGDSDMAHLISRIEKTIEEKYGFHVPVDIRTNREMEKIINYCPYEEAGVEKNGSKVLVTFLLSVPSATRIDDIKKYVVHPERLTIYGREVYLYCPNGYGKSKLSNTFLESKFDVRATTRNWKSVQKLYELSSL